MQGGSQMPGRAGGPARRAKPKAQPAKRTGTSGWDDVAAAKSEVFGDNYEEEKVPNATYHNQQQ